jgi:P27 family predicted phage terminase small subunit
MKGRANTITSAGFRRSPGSPLSELPGPPKWMRPVAVEQYHVVGEHLLRLGALTEGEVGLLTRYAATYARWWEAEEQLAALSCGYVRLVNRAGEPASSVAVPVQMASNKASDQLRHLEAALGLTPAERARLPSSDSATTIEDELEELVRQSARRDDQ